MRQMLLSLLLACSTLVAQQAPKTMTKMEVILQASDVVPGSFATKPKVMYRAGTKYCRIEESPDEEHKIHGLVIISEPDVWMINSADKSGRHLVDSGPTYNCRLPLFDVVGLMLPSEEAKPISELEFGQEIEFFQRHGATPHPGGVMQSKQTTAYKLQFGESSLGLFTSGTPERPLAVAWIHGGKNKIYWFSGYGQLDFDAKLFAKPQDVKVEEVKPQ